MDYFLEFRWWYVPIVFVLAILLFGRSKGGVVTERLTADLEFVDDRFANCQPEAKYSKFKQGSPDHFEIELENLSIPVGDKLEFLINGQTLATVAVEQDKEAEFDHWGDEGVEFPCINEGDRLLVKYQGAEVAHGVFQAKGQPRKQR